MLRAGPRDGGPVGSLDGLALGGGFAGGVVFGALVTLRIVRALVPTLRPGSRVVRRRPGAS
jgi:hypothetical protein